MNIAKKLSFCLLLAGFFAFIPLAHASADTGRYFVKSTKGFWKNALGVRHEFPNGFSTDLSDFQVQFTKVFGIDIEPVATLQILPAVGTPSKIVVPTPTGAVNKNAQTKNAKTAKPKLRAVPSDQTPWGIETVYNDPKIASTSGGAGIDVAVLDTGIDTSHPDLSSHIAECKDFTNPTFPVLDKRCDDKNGHGTHVAGIIAANSGADHLGLYGVAPSSQILAYKVCGADGSCYADDIATAIRLAADDGAEVINMSFGTSKDVDLIRDAVNYASSLGSVMVAAAGNEGPFPDSIDYPAAYASVISVGAIDQSRTVTDWSSRGDNTADTQYGTEDRDIEFVAPGAYIESTWNNDGYATLSGTSMASPFVAGLAAKYWQGSGQGTTQAQTTRDFLHSLAKSLPPPVDYTASGFGLSQVQ